MVELEVDQSTIRRAERLLRNIPNGSKRALTQATNRALSKGKTTIRKELTSRYTVKSSYVSSSLKINKANFGSITGNVVATSPVTPLYKFKTTPNKVTKRRPTTLRSEVKKGQAKNNPHAFIAQFNSGHIGVFLRETTSRFPINEVMGPSIPGMAKNEEIVDAVHSEMINMFNTRLDHEINRLLNSNR